MIEHVEGGAQYEFVLNPPKGTVNNRLWAETTVEAAKRNDFNALIIRPLSAGNLHVQSTQTNHVELTKIANEIKDMTEDELRNELLNLRARQRKQQIMMGTLPEEQEAS